MDCQDKRVALVGLGASQVDYCIAVQNSKTWDEVWCINSAISTYKCDRAFMMDPASRYLDTEDAGYQTEVMRKLLPKFAEPIYSCELDARVPRIVEYPIEEVVKTTKSGYFNNTVAYAVAFALHSKVKEINLFGIDFSYSGNLHFAEAGRACVEFWLCKCIEAGIQVGVSPRSGLLDQNVPLNERLYGYHRLEDQKIAMPCPDGEWVVCDRSNIQETLEAYGIEQVEEEKPPEPYKG